MKFRTPTKCLIIGPSWVGDMVMAQSLFIDLKQRYPDLVIDVLAPKWSKPILASMPEVNQSMTLSFQHGELSLRKRIRLGKQLKPYGYDWAIVLPNSFKSAIPLYFAGIRRRTGFKGEARYGLLNDVRKLDKSQLGMTVQRFVALGKDKKEPYDGSYPNPAMRVDINTIDAACKTFDLSTKQPMLALCPGAEFGPAKRWPVSHYAQVAKAIAAQGIQVIVLGSGKDYPVAADITSQSEHDNVMNLAGKTSMEQVIALLQQSSHAVSNDSGLMHIAAAVGTPVIALYGSSDPTFTPPLSEKATILDLNLSCSPCFKRECPLGTLACLNDIHPEKVTDILNQSFAS